MGVRSSLTRGAAAVAVAAVPLGLAATPAGASLGTASQRQTFTFTSQQTGQQVTCGIQHAVSAGASGDDYIVVFGSTEVDEGPAVCKDSHVTIVYFLDNGTDDDLSQYTYGTGGYAGFTNHFPDTWTFTHSNHRVYFNACSCSAPSVTLSPK